MSAKKHIILLGSNRKIESESGCARSRNVESYFNPIIHDMEYHKIWEKRLQKRNRYNKETYQKQKAGEYKTSRL